MDLLDKYSVIVTFNISNLCLFGVSDNSRSYTFEERGNDDN